MIKLVLLAFLLLFMRIPLAAQTAYWYEDFSSAQGWTLDDNWTLLDGKIQFYWSPIISNFDLSATSPLITLDQNTTDLVIKQFLHVYFGTNDEFAEIILITGDEEVQLWQYPLANGNWGSPAGSDLVIPIAQYAGTDVRIKFRTHGLNTINWNQWDLFDVQIMALFAHDLAVTEISGPVSVSVFETGTWTTSVSNLGTQSMTDFTVSIFDYKTNSLIGSTVEEGIIQPGQTMSYSIDWSSGTVLNTSFYATVSAADDMFSGNNIHGSWFVRVKPDMDINVLVWNKDNGIPTIVCPENGDLVRPSIGLTRVLEAADIDYTMVTQLPANLTEYDIVLVTMGCYCVD
ncbi:MAG: hypothetical protein ACNA7V_04970 [Bacteroidales bacterium]